MYIDVTVGDLVTATLVAGSRPRLTLPNPSFPFLTFLRTQSSLCNLAGGAGRPLTGITTTCARRWGRR